MTQTFFFYDLETSGLDPREDRIMQFAGIRTDAELKPIGDPYNILITLNDDTLPNPDALMVTGITPQKTLEEGYTEAQFAKILMDEIFTPDTIVVGFNNIHFDDEFIRTLFWRNFYDAYEWSWRDGRSRWDLLDVVRMTRALRPEGIKWPTVDGKPINRLEHITKENGIAHEHAHDALSDVEALISVTKLIKDKQPQLFSYLLKLRDKNEVKKLVNLDTKQPFVYVSGRYGSTYESATVAFPLTSSRNGNIAVYDLRYDPTPFVDLSLKELEAQMFASYEERKADGFVSLPVKELQYNRSPAVAPLGVLSQSDGWSRIGLDEATIAAHKTTLLESPAFAENIRSLYENRPEFKKSPDAEAQLYDGFIPSADGQLMAKIRSADATQLADLHPEFIDERLGELLLHYKARNYPQSLAQDEREAWEEWRAKRLQRQLPSFMARIQKLSVGASEETTFMLQELHLWAESIIPVDD
ncbi:exodeoxyribonuclease I [Candidatus Saccharibacteria bacterium]|nr:exodeoxyribonuclease I [Candidatus Saccharibacteria bacterium]